MVLTAYILIEQPEPKPMEKSNISFEQFRRNGFNLLTGFMKHIFIMSNHPHILLRAWSCFYIKSIVSEKSQLVTVAVQFDYKLLTKTVKYISHNSYHSSIGELKVWMTNCFVIATPYSQTRDRCPVNKG
jgi:hypothetical protein